MTFGVFVRMCTPLLTLRNSPELINTYSQASGAFASICDLRKGGWVFRRPEIYLITPSQWQMAVNQSRLINRFRFYYFLFITVCYFTTQLPATDLSAPSLDPRVGISIYSNGIDVNVETGAYMWTGSPPTLWQCIMMARIDCESKFTSRCTTKRIIPSFINGLPHVDFNAIFMLLIS